MKDFVVMSPASLREQERIYDLRRGASVCDVLRWVLENRQRGRRDLLYRDSLHTDPSGVQAETQHIAPSADRRQARQGFIFIALVKARTCEMLLRVAKVPPGHIQTSSQRT